MSTSLRLAWAHVSRQGSHWNVVGQRISRDYCAGWARRTFQDLADIHATHYDALKQKQPNGLFVFAGYSYGGTAAFELAMRIEAAGDKVKFIGSFNLPLYTKGITRRLDWTGCLLNVAFFCDLFPYALADKLAPEIRDLAKSEQLARVMAEANSVRRVESGITPASLETWTELTFSLQISAINTIHPLSQLPTQYNLTLFVFILQQPLPSKPTTETIVIVTIDVDRPGHPHKQPQTVVFILQSATDTSTFDAPHLSKCFRQLALRGQSSQSSPPLSSPNPTLLRGPPHSSTPSALGDPHFFEIPTTNAVNLPVIKAPAPASDITTKPATPNALIIGNPVVQYNDQFNN
ncbi:unnamed protein product [Penicillium discolor]